MSGKTITSRLIVSLLDGVSGPAAKAGAALTALKNRAAFSVGAGMAGVQGAMAGIAANAKKAGAAVDKVTTAVQPLALGSMFGFFKAYEFEKAMNTMEALGELTKVQRKEAEDYIKVISQKYPRSMVKLAQVWNELLRGGLSFDAAKGALGSTMDLSIYGDIDPKAASEIAINALNQFRMPMATVEQAQASMKKVADVIAYAANKSATDVRLMGETFKYAAPMATALGMSMDELGAAAMIMANNGIKGSEAGVAIRSGMVRLLKPTKDMQATLARLNIDLADFKKKGHDITAKELVDALQADGIDATKLSGGIKKALADPGLKAAPQRMVAELTKIISDGLGSSSIMDKDKLAEHLTDTLTAAGSTVDLLGFIKALTDKAGPEIGNVIARVFDVRQGARLMTLSAGDVKAMLKGIIDESEGYAAKGTAIMLQGTVGAVERLMTALGAFFVQVSQAGVFEALTEGAKAATSFLKAAGDASPTLLKWGTYALMAAAALSVLKTAISGVMGLLSLLRIGLVAITGSIGMAVAGLGALAYFNWNEVKAGWSAFSSGFSKGFWDNLKIPDSVGHSWENLKRQFESVSGLKLDLPSWQHLGQTLGGTVASGVNLLAAAFERVCNWISQAIGLAKSAAAAFSSIGSLQAPGGVQRGLPQGFSAPGKAAGGPVTGGRPYVVGEVGPELFVPRSSGSIVPNHALGSRAGPISLSIVNHINGASDPGAVAADVVRRVEAKINELFRGVQADAGLRWT